MKALRVEAAATVAEAKLASVTAQTAASEVRTGCLQQSSSADTKQASKSLKRKRDDLEDGQGEGASVPSNLTDVRDLHAPPLPISKRRRTLRVVSKVAQTATVASLGAVAAWAALAFS